MITQQTFSQNLVTQGIISPDDHEKALQIQQQIDQHIGAILIRLGSLSEEVLLSQLAEVLEMPVLSYNDFPIDFADYQTWLHEVNLDQQWLITQNFILFPNEEQSILYAVMKYTYAPWMLEFAQKFAEDHTFEAEQLHFALARGDDIEQFLNRLEQHNELDSSTNTEQHLRELAEEAPIIELVNNLFSQAADKGASDIHLDPQRHTTLVRFRLDGVLYQQSNIPQDRFSAVVSRIKLLADLDIAEKRLPQDGRISIKVSGKSFDVRVSTLPGVHGETIVLRLLPTEQKTLSLGHLGMAEDHIALFQQLIHKPHGIFLVTGPTGSGKTTTLYTALDGVNDGHKKIITVEDPVEYQMDGIAQTQVHSEIKLTFAKILRTILRQDPDVIMVGEIRDLETAEIAIQASLTGHLVLSTLHTNDSISAFTRLIDMGVDPFLVANPVIAVMAQRLLRKLCTHCSEPATLDLHSVQAIETIVKRYNIDTPAQFRQAGEGCKHCSHTGYSGRSGIYELVAVSDHLRSAIIDGSDTLTLWQIAQQEGVRNLKEDGYLKVWQGVTSLEEVMRVTTE